MKTRIALAVGLLSVSLAGHAFEGVQVVTSFTGLVDGANPSSRMVLGPDGRLWGMTAHGGSNDFGTIYALSLDGNVRVMHAFNGNDGVNVSAGLVLAADGAFYGTAANALGLPARGGLMFRVNPANGGFTTLYRFPTRGTLVGYRPGELVDGGDGYLYGTNHNGGSGLNAAGSVFRATLSGQVQTLHNFVAGEGQLPEPGLTRCSDGNFYGALAISPTNQGSVFRITPGGAVTVLHNFQPGEGSQPQPWLAEGPSGVFYGVTRSGGADNQGTVFRMDSDGSVATLHHFTGDGGAAPVAVVMGSDGNLYGVTEGGGRQDQGTVFRVTPGGQFTTLRLLGSNDGAKPTAPPMIGPDGLLYATTSTGGATLRGTVFRMDTAAVQPADAVVTKQCFQTIPNATPPAPSNGCRPVVNIYVGESYRIDWASANADSCTASGAWSGPQPIEGHFEVFPTQQGVYTYTLSCAGPGGSAQASQTVTVGPPL